ncbi:hypothetical protein B0T17DRAFT_612881 [Bombardia bombarda]|uniref:DUF8021 domain-containing protein n=1 Tax=Bombardia bombarda TaxID=252184 RepID=A0AA39XM32_9PEZI|nr:hypothetical protein B0T17DRAFT_612881 [Bombardia bombarda]
MAAKIRNALAAAWLCSALAPGYVSSQVQARCDRACLEGLVSEHLTALAAHDPQRLPTTSGVKYVENAQHIPLGAGVWPIAGSLGKYRHVFSDPESGQVAAITTITENNIPAIYLVRLKAEPNGQISEIEAQLTRDDDGAILYEKMANPDPVWLAAVPEPQRISRARLVAQVDKYYSGMQGNDPRGDYSFFDRECDRLEDAVQTTNQHTGDTYGHSNDTSFASLSCEAQFQTGFLGFVTRIRDRRYVVVDEERQAVFAIASLDHNGTVRTLPSVNGTSSPIPAYFDVPRTLLGMEAFRLRGDKLYRIEMTLAELPYGMRSAFDSKNSNSAASQFPRPGNSTSLTTPSRPCNRTCLNGLPLRVLRAMLARNASSLPLARNIRYSENGQFLGLDDGLWLTLSNVSIPDVDEYAANFADDSSRTAGYWGLVKELTTPGVLSLRVQVDKDGKITEIEAINVRAEAPKGRGNTITLMRPPLPVEWEGGELGRLGGLFQGNGTALKGSKRNATALAKVAAAYFDGLERHSSKRVPFAAGCVRRDNGALQGNVSCAGQMDGRGQFPNGLSNSTTAVRDRRVLVADRDKGVVLAVVMVDFPATTKGGRLLSETEIVPSTYMVPQLIKIDHGGAISRVEAMIKWMPFGYTSAWGELGLEGKGC